MDVYRPTNNSIPYMKDVFQENAENSAANETDWPLEAVVSIVVPFFFGMIGLAGLLGNALVVLGEILYFIRLM